MTPTARHLTRAEEAARPSAPRRRRHAVRGLIALVAAFAVVAVTPAFAAKDLAFRISEDPFTNSTSQHRTEVEPDTFSFGPVVVSAFQVGRFFNGGASDIGFATSFDDGNHFTEGFLPGVTKFTTPAGSYDRASDASVAFDSRHQTWLISYLAIHETPTGGTGVVDVLVSRSPDGIHWGMPVAVAVVNQFLDKNWTVCDNTPASRFFGNCYTEYDIATQGDLEQMSTSTDGGLTWGPGKATADSVHGLGGQPLVQPDGRVVVPFEGIRSARGIRAFASDDGGASWNASVLISSITAHRVAGNVRTSPLPTAELDGDGKVFVAWQDCRFEALCAANDIVVSTSLDATTWSPVRRIPTDPVGSGMDHFIPGLGVSSAFSGDHGRLALTYYYYPNTACTADTCQMNVGFVTSKDGGQTWTHPEQLAGPIGLSWIAKTTQGVMVGDYISTSVLNGGGKAVAAFAIATQPPPDGVFDEPTAAAVEEIRNGDVPLVNDPVLFTIGSPSTGGVDEGGDDEGDGIP